MDVLRLLNEQRKPGTPEITVAHLRELLRIASIPAGCTKAYCTLSKPMPATSVVDSGKNFDDPKHRKGYYYWGGVACKANSICPAVAVSHWADSICDCEAHDINDMPNV